MISSNRFDIAFIVVLSACGALAGACRGELPPTQPGPVTHHEPPDTSTHDGPIPGPQADSAPSLGVGQGGSASAPPATSAPTEDGTNP
jgi:hypothetical protein